MWTEIASQGKEVDLFEPSSRPVGGCVFLHDRDQRTLRELGDSSAWTESRRFAIACPHGGECWWTSRIWPPFDAHRSAEQWLMHSLLPDLKARWGETPIAIAGIGMGGQGALRLAFKYPEAFAVVAAVNAAVDCHDLYYEGTPLDEIYSSREHCRQDSPVLHISPVKQPRHIFFACATSSRWQRGNDRLHEKLTALGVEHRFATEKENAGLAPLLDFVEKSLASEGRRLL